MRKFRNYGGLIVICAVVSSCASISPETKSHLRKPIDCAHAQEDIAALEAAKASTLKRRVSLASLISPLGLTLGFLTRSIDDRAEVASGQHNHRLDDRIISIRYECGL